MTFSNRDNLLDMAEVAIRSLIVVLCALAVLAVVLFPLWHFTRACTPTCMVDRFRARYFVDRSHALSSRLLIAARNCRTQVIDEGGRLQVLVDRQMDEISEVEKRIDTLQSEMRRGK